MSRLTPCLFIIGCVFAFVGPAISNQVCSSLVKGDIVFTLDESGSVGLSQFNTSLNWLTEVLAAFRNDIDNDDVRVGVIKFASSTTTSITLGPDTYLNLRSKILNIPYFGGSTFIGRAIRNSVAELDNRGRSNVPQIIVLLTDGTSSDLVLPDATIAREKNITTIAVGVGNGVNDATLLDIAGTQTRVFSVSGFDNLAQIENELRDVIIETTCQGPTENQLTVTCLRDSMSVQVESAYYIANNVGLTDLHLNDFSCKGYVDSVATNQWIFNITTFSSCSTIYTSNSTHLTYSNTISNALEGNNVYVTSAHLATFSCSYEKNLDNLSLFSIGYYVIQNIRNITAPSGLGQFEASINHYSDLTYQNLEQKIVFQTTDTLYIKVQLYANDPTLNLLIDDCWVTPSPNISDQIRYTFISNGCPVSRGNVQITSNGNGSVATFESKVFAFIEYDVTYLHCSLEICSSAGGVSCIPVCSNRKKRSKDSYKVSRNRRQINERENFKEIVSTGPFTIKRENDASTSIPLTTLLAVAAVAVFFVVASIATTALCFRRRHRLEKKKLDPVSYINTAIS